MEGRPATIRFLDPPLHEFLPTADEDIRDLAKDMGLTFESLKATVEGLHEFNPMMGHRGCRLAVSYPEIAEMQTRAVIEAALNVRRETGMDIVPEIMIPLVGEIKELAFVKKTVVETAAKVMEERGETIKYHVGTMIEIPRAALTADEIAQEAEFFSFGTNDLTQMTFGFSRDDAGKFLPAYYSGKIYESARAQEEHVVVTGGEDADPQPGDVPVRAGNLDRRQQTDGERRPASAGGELALALRLGERGGRQRNDTQNCGYELHGLSPFLSFTYFSAFSASSRSFTARAFSPL